MMQESGGRVETMYDKLNSLAAEISEGIINLGGERRDKIQQELSELRAQAYKERSPEAVFNIVLFRKYADIANRIKDSKEDKNNTADSHHGLDRTTFVGNLPDFVYKADDESMFVGQSATKANIFKFRACVAVFSLIAFSVMSSVPYINEADFHPEHHFLVHVRLMICGSAMF
jgi:hypothetical protein